MADTPEQSASKNPKPPAATADGKRAHPLLVLLAGFVSAMLLLFGCLCGGALWWFRPQIHEEPDRARELLTEIVDIRIPDVYQPQGTVEWNLAFLMDVRGVYYERFVGDGILTIVEVTSRIGMDDDVRRHIRQTLLEKGGGGAPLVINDAETERRRFEIRGEEVPFTFEIGRDPPSGRTFRIVEGVFDGKAGQVLLSLRVNEEHWDVGTIVEMLQSIGRFEGERLSVPDDEAAQTP